MCACVVFPILCHVVISIYRVWIHQSCSSVSLINIALGTEYKITFYIMNLVNINYKCKIVEGRETLNFSNRTPCQAIIRIPNKYTLIVFPSGNARLMGCKAPIESSCVKIDQITVLIKCIQSVTVVVDMRRTFNLINVSLLHWNNGIIYEPELFPAIRIMEFAPLCVNLFASGKVVITGLKTLHYYKLVERIIAKINTL